MIIRVSYQVDIKEVPVEVAKLLNSLQEEVEKLSQNLTKASDELGFDVKDVRAPLIKIEHSLTSLENVKTKLKDCELILKGYDGIVNNPSEKKQ